MAEIEDYSTQKESARTYYSQIGSVFSPVLKQKVNFNSAGFNHIIQKDRRHTRDISSQLLRFKLLPLAIEIIQISTTHQEFEKTIDAEYWGLIAIVHHQKIKVVLKKSVNGSIYFWSVIPAWKTNKHRDIRFFTTMDGNPEED